MVREFFALTSLAKITLTAFITPIVLSVLSAISEGISVSLLIPVVNGIIRREQFDFSSWPLIGERINQLLPHYASFNAKTVLVCIALVFLFAVLKSIFNYSSSVRVVKISTRFVANLRAMLFEQFLSFGKLYFDSTRSGSHQELLTTHVKTAGNLMMLLQQVFFALSTLTIYGMILLVISWKLTLIVLVVFPLTYFWLGFIIKKIKATSRDLTRVVNMLGAQVNETFHCMSLIKATASEKEELARFRHTNEYVSSMMYSMGKKQGVIPAVQEIIALGVILALVCVIGYFLKTEGPEYIAAYIVYVIVLRRAAALIGVFSNFLGHLAGVTGELQQFKLLLSEEGKYQVDFGAVTCKGLHESLEFRNVQFTFPNGTSALSNVNAMVGRGECIALVGHSGAGKSTLMSLLLRFYDSPKGSIFVDGTDIREFTKESWADTVAYVMQDSLLFDKSVRDNIAYGYRGEVTEERIWEVVKASVLEDVVNGLPDGLDTLVGERGVQLSGGEKQRVSIARAMLRDADLLLLDEATSALDSETEALVQKALKRLIKDRTTIVIAHRLNTIKDADRVLVLKDGALVEQGSPQELLDKKSYFYEFWSQQQIA